MGTRTRTRARSETFWFPVYDPNPDATHLRFELERRSPEVTRARLCLYAYSRGEVHKTLYDEHVEDWEITFPDACYEVRRDAGGTTYDVINEYLAESCQVGEDLTLTPMNVFNVEPHHFTEKVVAVLRGVGEDDAFDRLPIVADLLMDAGYADNQGLLRDFRGTGYTAPRVAFYRVVGLSGLLDEAFNTG